jgi:ribose/xylose/arabinose/galactoside ABC-type transport system permease subunit
MTTWLTRLGPLAGLAAVLLLFAALRPAQFATGANAEIMLLQTAVVATAALGMTLVIVSGGIDLSVGSQIALATVTLASLLARGWSPAAAALAAVACGAVVGCLIGGLVAGLRLPPFIATGSSEPTARLCGVAVDRVKILVYAIASALAAVAGVLQYAYLTVGDSTTALGMELDIIAAVVIGGASLAGGRGSVAGTLIGALIMTAVANGCTKLELPNWVQEIVTGAIIVAAVAIDRFRRRDE